MSGAKNNDNVVAFRTAAAEAEAEADREVPGAPSYPFGCRPSRILMALMARFEADEAAAARRLEMKLVASTEPSPDSRGEDAE